MEENSQGLNILIANITSLSALMISIVALIYTIRAYILKSGHSIRGNFSTASSIACEDKYVASLTLENLKDRATVIFKIYLKIGNNYFLELEDHSNKPLIINPFDVYQKKYEPIIYYSINTNIIKIDKLLDNPKIKKQIVLSTTMGKYKIKTNIKSWDAIRYFFKNYMTAIIIPVRMLYNDVAYGINVKYLLHFTNLDHQKEIVPLYEGDERFEKFKKWELSSEILKNKHNLEEHFKRLKGKKIVEYKELQIFEFKKECFDRYGLEKKKVIEAKHYNIFQYLFLGRLYTYLENKRIKKINLKSKKAV